MTVEVAAILIALAWLSGWFVGRGEAREEERRRGR